MTDAARPATDPTPTPPGQFFTPEWAALALVERYFPALTAADRVVEPSCGRGAFLKAIPPETPALGVELDPALAAWAARDSGRPVLCGDFRTVALPWNPTVILGNPPFDLRLLEQFLARARSLLPATGRCGFLLPAYAVQTPARVVGWSTQWSLLAELVPRTLFPGLRLPLIFVLFTKTTALVMVGFALYREQAEIGHLAQAAQLVLVRGRPRTGVWQALVEATLEARGGTASLPELYQAIEPHRPTPTAWWREKVRQTLQRHCRPIERGRWALAAPDGPARPALAS